MVGLLLLANGNVLVGRMTEEINYAPTSTKKGIQIVMKVALESNDNTLAEKICVGDCGQIDGSMGKGSRPRGAVEKRASYKL